MGGPVLGGNGPVLLLVEGGPCELVLGLLDLGVGSMDWLAVMCGPLGVLPGVMVAGPGCCEMPEGVSGGRWS